MGVGPAAAWRKLEAPRRDWGRVTWTPFPETAMTAHPPATFARAGRLSISLVLGSAAACSSWHTQAATPSEVLAVRRPSSARVTLAGGSTGVVHRPRIAGDTLTGWPDGG